MRIAFDECDSQGVVFFAAYFRLAHRVLEEFLPEVGIAWSDWFASPAYAVPIRKAQAEYFQPLNVGDSYTVGVQVGPLRESSVQIYFDFLDEDGNLCARVETIHVFVDKKKKRKTKIPNPIRVALG